MGIIKETAHSSRHLVFLAAKHFDLPERFEYHIKYEIVPAGLTKQGGNIDPLKYVNRASRQGVAGVSITKGLNRSRACWIRSKVGYSLIRCIPVFGSGFQIIKQPSQ